MNDFSYSSYGVLNSLGAAYFEVDLKGIMIHCNQAFVDKAELTIETCVGKNYRHLVDSRQVKEMYAAFNTVYKTRETRRILFNFIRHRSGGFRTAEGTIGPIITPLGEVIGFRGIMFDVTERIQEQMDMLAAKQAAENELAIGRKIQYTFLPPTLPKVDGWDIDMRFHSAREVAGDFYDIFPVSNGTRMGFVVADVCDKGIGAAMYMAIFRTMIRAFANINTATSLTMAVIEDDPKNMEDISLFKRRRNLSVGAHPLKNAIEMTNQYIARYHGSSNMFATVFFGVLNPQDGKLIYINAGHEPPILVSDGKISQRLEPTGPAVGLMEDLKFEIGEVEIKQGDFLFIYTDGVTDAQNQDRQPFSEERMIREIEETASEPSKVLRKIMSSLHDHISEQDQFDDITLLGVYRK